MICRNEYIGYLSFLFCLILLGGCREKPSGSTPPPTTPYQGPASTEANTTGKEVLVESEENIQTTSPDQDSHQQKTSVHQGPQENTDQTRILPTPMDQIPPNLRFILEDLQRLEQTNGTITFMSSSRFQNSDEACQNKIRDAYNQVSEAIDQISHYGSLYSEEDLSRSYNLGTDNNLRAALHIAMHEWQLCTHQKYLASSPAENDTVRKIRAFVAFKEDMIAFVNREVFLQSYSPCQIFIIGRYSFNGIRSSDLLWQDIIIPTPSTDELETQFEERISRWRRCNREELFSRVDLDSDLNVILVTDNATKALYTEIHRIADNNRENMECITQLHKAVSPNSSDIEVMRADLNGLCQIPQN